ncbi:MAG: hypothetical protein HOL01_04430 [Planctomycetaceae bacterium]|jgi:hypothetical protein|nr:hypothetical protein [Planctomycetaceae bacterium]MBT6488076.1 hypothetical protein [Planctomycetaceae bacterium]MBT6493782.1 hypothetical protein [Planctomycetaceae bacterium]
MFDFKDFIPRQFSPPGFLKRAEYGSFDDAASAAAQWAKSKDARIINVETVVLPNIHDSYEEGSTDAAINTSGKMHSSWHQFVRVWYEEV